MKNCYICCSINSIIRLISLITIVTLFILYLINDEFVNVIVILTLSIFVIVSISMAFEITNCSNCYYVFCTCLINRNTLNETI